MYRCRKNFRFGKKPYKIDQPFKGSKDMVNDMLKRGLLYETKEDKTAYSLDNKVYIEKDKNTKTMYYVKKGNQIIDRLPESKAEQLKEELNAKK
jgi:hypothetical protein